MNQVSEGGACFSEDINKIEEQNKSVDPLGVSFISHGIFLPCNGPSRNDISTHMISVQDGAESISCDVNISLTQEKNYTARDREVLEEGKNVITYERKKRLKKAELADLPRTDLKKFNEGADSSLGNVHQTIGYSSLEQPVEFESVPHYFSSSMSEKSEMLEDGISAEVVQKSLDEPLHCSSEFQKTSLDKYDRMLIGIDDANETGDVDMHALMLPESRAGNGKVLNVVSTETDTDEVPGVASSGACCKDFSVHLDIKEQCLSKHATTKKRKSCDADMLVSNHLEELHDEAKETVSVVEGDALGGDTPLYHEEQSVASSHADLSLELLDGTQGVASGVVSESINVPVDTAFAGCKQKKLLVLDINGLLVDISSYVPYYYDPDDIIMKKAVFRRPHCDDFLKFCFEKFNVGFWTSRTKRNMEPLLDFILGKNKSRLLFYWDQSHCTDTGFYTVEKRHKPLLLKKLKKLWDKREPGLPWERGVYDESNTLLLDDTPYKALSNPRYTAVFPYTYRFRDVRDNSLGPGGDLRVYLEGLAKAENVQEYVKQNPFGQRAITEKNLSWGYYRKVIAANSTPPRQTDTNDPL